MRHVKSLKTIVNPQIRLDRSQLLNLTLSKFLDLFFLRNYLSRTRSGQSRWPDHYYEQNTVPDRPFFPHRLDEAGCGISGGRKYLDDLVAYEFGVAWCVLRISARSIRLSLPCMTMKVIWSITFWWRVTIRLRNNLNVVYYAAMTPKSVHESWWDWNLCFDNKTKN